jgi:hypothetical protein
MLSVHAGVVAFLQVKCRLARRRTSVVKRTGDAGAREAGRADDRAAGNSGVAECIRSSLSAVAQCIRNSRIDESPTAWPKSDLVRTDHEKIGISL